LCNTSECAAITYEHFQYSGHQTSWHRHGSATQIANFEGTCESGIVGIRRMNHQLERTAVAESNGREVTHIARGQTMDAERFGERHDRTIDEAEAEIREASVHFHRP